MSRRAIFFACAVSFVAVAIACSSFTSNDDATPVGDAGDAAPTPPPPNEAAADDGSSPSPACDAGAPDAELLASDDAGIDDIAADGTHVYWASRAGGRISRVTLASRSVETFVADAGAAAEVALTTASVVWNNGAIWSASKTSGASASFVDSLNGPRLLVGTPMKAYYVLGGGIRAVDNAGKGAGDVVAAIPGPKALSASTSVVAFVDVVGDASGLPSLAWTSGTSGYTVLAGAANALRLANDSDTIWMSEQRQILAFRIVDGARSTLVSGQQDIGELVADDAHVFFSTSDGVRRVAKAGGCIANVSDEATNALAVDSTWIFFVRGGRDLLRVPR